MKSNNVLFFFPFLFFFLNAHAHFFISEHANRTCPVEQTWLNYKRATCSCGVCWKSQSLGSLLSFFFFFLKCSAELTTNLCFNMATDKNDLRPSDNKANTCKRWSHVCHSAAWRRFLLDDAWNNLEQYETGDSDWDQVLQIIYKQSPPWLQKPVTFSSLITNPGQIKTFTSTWYRCLELD